MIAGFGAGAVAGAVGPAWRRRCSYIWNACMRTCDAKRSAWRAVCGGGARRRRGGVRLKLLVSIQVPATEHVSGAPPRRAGKVTRWQVCRLEYDTYVSNDIFMRWMPLGDAQGRRARRVVQHYQFAGFFFPPTKIRTGTGPSGRRTARAASTPPWGAVLHAFVIQGAYGIFRSENLTYRRSVCARRRVGSAHACHRRLVFRVGGKEHTPPRRWRAPPP